MGSSDPFGLVGHMLDAQFRVDSVVGEGALSVVYKGHHTSLDEPVAVKCLRVPHGVSAEVIESVVLRFRDESKLRYRLSQGSLFVARSIASGTTRSPLSDALVPYMIVEWLDGQTLATELAERRARGERGRALEEIVKLFDPAVEALAYAHSLGVVHRDVSPRDLFLTKTPQGIKLKVLDFGVAKILNEHALEMAPRARTVAGFNMFAPAYGAPEQFDDRVGKVGAWTDVYALAIVLLEALTDRRVVEGANVGEYAQKVLDSSLRPTPRGLRVAVGDEVQEVFARAVAIAPAERPQDAGEFWGMLKHAMKVDADSGVLPYAPLSERPPPTIESVRPMPTPARAIVPHPIGSREAVPRDALVVATRPMGLGELDAPVLKDDLDAPRPSSAELRGGLWVQPASPDPPRAPKSSAAAMLREGGPSRSRKILAVAIVSLAAIVLLSLIGLALRR